MPEMLMRLDWSREQIEAEQRRGLRETLAIAQEKSPFYAARLRGVDPNSFTLADLPHIQPVTKSDVMEHWDGIVTDPRLTLDQANAHLAALRDETEDNAYFRDEFYLCATGGSSGRRGLFLWDADFFATAACVAYRLEAREDELNPPTGPRRTAVICAGSYLHASRMIFPISPDLEREILPISASESIQVIVEMLNSFQPDRIVSYSSIMEELCAEASAGHLQISPRRISVNSEPLTDDARAATEALWGINIHNAWGSVEMGMCGMEGDQFDGLILSEDVCIFEAIDDDGAIIQAGQADHLLVTRLYGNTLPLIRYELTDSLLISPHGSSNAPAYRRVSELAGRSDVWFLYGEQRVHPMVFRGVLGQEPAIVEYQVRQTRTGADIDLITQAPLDLPLIQRQLIQELASQGVIAPSINVAIVNELPRHIETGKLTRFLALK
ncbi:coenzyme F390 synthetase [Cerasicoccus arenae]|uniref:Coenzyme F390 synthetase n=2 Tax=Cerasicoccus arenae TaxID=424488 RepID=A0A8J3GDI5_9BACT|nr:coenzyme F390 synthetase [Cerasicoccus arenae]